MEEDPEELSAYKCKELIHDRLLQSGQLLMLKKLLRNRLLHHGWMTNVRQDCMDYIQRKGTDNVNISHMSSDLTGPAKDKCPEDIRNEILEFLQDFSQLHLNIDDAATTTEEGEESFQAKKFSLDYQSRDAKPEPAPVRPGSSSGPPVLVQATIAVKKPPPALIPRVILKPSTKLLSKNRPSHVTAHVKQPTTPITFPKTPSPADSGIKLHKSHSSSSSQSSRDSRSHHVSSKHKVHSEKEVSKRVNKPSLEIISSKEPDPWKKVSTTPSLPPSKVHITPPRRASSPSGNESSSSSLSLKIKLSHPHKKRSSSPLHISSRGSSSTHSPKRRSKSPSHTSKRRSSPKRRSPSTSSLKRKSPSGSSKRSSSRSSKKSLSPKRRPTPPRPPKRASSPVQSSKRSSTTIAPPPKRPISPIPQTKRHASPMEITRRPLSPIPQPTKKSSLEILSEKENKSRKSDSSHSQSKRALSPILLSRDNRSISPLRAQVPIKTSNVHKNRALSPLVLKSVKNSSSGHKRNRSKSPKRVASPIPLIAVQGLNKHSHKSKDRSPVITTKKRNTSPHATKRSSSPKTSSSKKSSSTTGSTTSIASTVSVVSTSSKKSSSTDLYSSTVVLNHKSHSKSKRNSSPSRTEKEKSRDKDKDKDKEKSKDKEKNKNKDKEKEKNKDKDKEKNKDKGDLSSSDKSSKKNQLTVSVSPPHLSKMSSLSSPNLAVALDRKLNISTDMSPPPPPGPKRRSDSPSSAKTSSKSSSQSHKGSMMTKSTPSLSYSTSSSSSSGKGKDSSYGSTKTPPSPQGTLFKMSNPPSMTSHGGKSGSSISVSHATPRNTTVAAIIPPIISKSSSSSSMTMISPTMATTRHANTPQSGARRGSSGSNSSLSSSLSKVAISQPSKSSSSSKNSDSFVKPSAPPAKRSSYGSLQPSVDDLFTVPKSVVPKTTPQVPNPANLKLSPLDPSVKVSCGVPSGKPFGQSSTTNRKTVSSLVGAVSKTPTNNLSIGSKAMSYGIKTTPILPTPTVRTTSFAQAAIKARFPALPGMGGNSSASSRSNSASSNKSSKSNSSGSSKGGGTQSSKGNQRSITLSEKTPTIPSYGSHGPFKAVAPKGTSFAESLTMAARSSAALREREGKKKERNSVFSSNLFDSFDLGLGRSKEKQKKPPPPKLRNNPPRSNVIFSSLLQAVNVAVEQSEAAGKADGDEEEELMDV